MTEPALVSPADLAARWSVSEDFVRRLCGNGGLRFAPPIAPPRARPQV